MLYNIEGFIRVSSTHKLIDFRILESSESRASSHRPVQDCIYWYSDKSG